MIVDSVSATALTVTTTLNAASKDSFDKLDEVFAKDTADTKQKVTPFTKAASERIEARGCTSFVRRRSVRILRRREWRRSQGPGTRRDDSAEGTAAC